MISLLQELDYTLFTYQDYEGKMESSQLNASF